MKIIEANFNIYQSTESTAHLELYIEIKRKLWKNLTKKQKGDDLYETFYKTPELFPNLPHNNMVSSITYTINLANAKKHAKIGGNKMDNIEIILLLSEALRADFLDSYQLLAENEKEI